jgi:radical SAM protein with 4Fe4S-binding SPASM domain
MEIDIIPKSLILQWHITERCNWRCKHCYQENYETPEMNLGQISNVLEQYVGLIKKWGIEKMNAHLSVTGGEPLIRSDFFQILARVHKFGDIFSYIILSNGSLLDEEKIKKLKIMGNREYQVSLEGMEENNDIIRGKGSFRKVVKAVKLLLKHGIVVRISLSLSKKNMNDVEAMADFFGSLVENKGHITIGARRIVPWGSGSEMKEFMLEPEELKKFYEGVERINKKMIKKGLSLKVMGGCENGIFNDLISSPALMSVNHCAIMDGRILVLLPNGDVYPCRRLPIKVGNVLEQTLEEIYYSDMMKNLRNKNNKHAVCQKCENFQNCFGGAPCVTYAYTGKINIPDVQCFRAYNNLDEAINNKYTEKI